MTKHQNRVTLLGVTAEAPEWRTTRSGQRVMFLRLRTDDDARARSQWHKITVFDERIIQQFSDQRIGKGDLIRVEGELHYRKRHRPEDRDQTSRWQPPEAQVVVDMHIGRIEILAAKMAGAAGDQARVAP